MLKGTAIPATQANGTETAPVRRWRIEGGLIKGTYVSGEEQERNGAREVGYETVCQHPIEVGVLGTDELLVLDFDNALFGDYSEVVQAAAKAARAGVTVGIHTFYPHHPLIEAVAKIPGVTIAKTHRELQDVLGIED